MKEKPQKPKTIKYVLGTIALASISVVVVPKLIELGTEYFNPKKPQDIEPLGDDWGPEIVKKSELEEE